jgi:uncharacterized protein (TIGR03000 family)
MIRQALSFAGLLLLTGAAALATPGLSQAQRGGGHGGGGHGGGGFHGGVGHFGGFHGPARFGGFHNFRPYYGFYGYYPYYYGSYGYYPYIYGGDYSYYNTYPDIGSGLAYDPGYITSYGSVTPDATGGTAAPPAITSQSLYPPVSAAAPADALAHVTVKVPADARVWFENTPTTSTGPVRQFDSPPLAPGGRYTYSVRAAWTENGHEVTQTQQVGVSAGARVEVDFPVKPESAGQAAVTKGS